MLHGYGNSAFLGVCSQITKFMGPTWGPPGSCRLQMGPMLAPWTLLSGLISYIHSMTLIYKPATDLRPVLSSKPFVKSSKIQVRYQVIKDLLASFSIGRLHSWHINQSKVSKSVLTFANFNIKWTKLNSCKTSEANQTRLISDIFDIFHTTDLLHKVIENCWLIWIIPNTCIAFLFDSDFCLTNSVIIGKHHTQLNTCI